MNIVLTVKDQAKYVGKFDGALSKNLFFKDKKSKLYIVSALADTKFDLKVLSQRLGLGKGGVRMDPEEAFAEVLQVPLGCVTPFALINGSTSQIIWQSYQKQKCLRFWKSIKTLQTGLLEYKLLNAIVNKLGKEVMGNQGNATSVMCSLRNMFVYFSPSS